MLASFYKVTSRQKQCPPAKSILKSKAIQGVSLILYGIEKKKKKLIATWIRLQCMFVGLGGHSMRG